MYSARNLNINQSWLYLFPPAPDRLEVILWVLIDNFFKSCCGHFLVFVVIISCAAIAVYLSHWSQRVSWAYRWVNFQVFFMSILTTF